MSYQYAKFKENPCVGTDASTPLHGQVAEELMPIVDIGAGKR